MGLDANGVKFLLVARDRGASLERVAMIGRQQLYLREGTLRRILASFGIQMNAREVAELYAEQGGYAEPLLRMLGAERVDSIDASEFEGASIVHDMNLPIQGQLREAYTLVLDGGSLEHIFAFPQAIQNCMEMLSVRGHFLGISPANNYAGHGFYQFSPELYFRIFTQDHGFRMDKLVVFQDEGTRWYEVADPAVVGRRVTLTNRRPTLMAVLAEKIGAQGLSIPQQSDYSAKWSSTTAARLPRARRPLVQRSLRRLVAAMKVWWRGEFHTRFYARDRSADGIALADRSAQRRRGGEPDGRPVAILLRDRADSADLALGPAGLPSGK